MRGQMLDQLPDFLAGQWVDMQGGDRVFALHMVNQFGQGFRRLVFTTRCEQKNGATMDMPREIA
ncbi:MAG: hypothetical protein NVSMB38_24760 [Ktedonobacteraceae bacterium]